uniref:Uncharacterized protein n=1 Tax=Hucho hucho TaxID=62062 RepID=A0A4W5K1Y6_9TELE
MLFFQIFNWNFILLPELTDWNLNCLQPWYRSREQLMMRANSLKKALSQIIEQAEKVVDEQNRHTHIQCMSSSSSMKRENSEELKEPEPRE